MYKPVSYTHLPELDEKKDFIFRVLTQEEEKFNKTIDQGLSILADMQAEMEKNNQKVLSGEDAFKLYDTYGFPIDLTQEILEEKGFSIDEDGFKAAMEEQRTKARNARKVTNYMGCLLYTSVSFIEPMNEPDTNYWANGSTKQEGCTFDPGAEMSDMLVEMQKALVTEGLDENIKIQDVYKRQGQWRGQNDLEISNFRIISMTLT